MVSGSRISQLLVPTTRDSLAVAAKTISRPTVTFSEIEIPHGNETFKLAGKTNWASEPVEITFDDVIPNSSTLFSVAADGSTTGGDATAQFSASQIFYDWMTIQQSPFTGAAALSSDYKCNIILSQYDPAGAEIERIMYHGAYLQNFSAEGMDYSSEDGGVVVTASFPYDKVFKLQSDATTAPANANEAFTVANESVQADPDDNSTPEEITISL